MLVGVLVDPGFKKIDYDGKALKKPMRKAGNEVKKIARKLISRRAVSKAGEFPGRQTGRMQKSLRVKVSKSGYSVSIYPDKTDDMPAFYPAFVVYGHRGPGSQANDGPSHRNRKGKKVAAPRENFVPAAAEKYAETFQKNMFEALGEAIK